MKLAGILRAEAMCIYSGIEGCWVFSDDGCWELSDVFLPGELSWQRDPALARGQVIGTLIVVMTLTSGVHMPMGCHGPGFWRVSAYGVTVALGLPSSSRWWVQCLRHEWMWSTCEARF